MTLWEFLPEQLIDTALVAGIGGVVWWLIRGRSVQHRFRAAVTVPVAVGSYFAAGFVCWMIWPTMLGDAIATHSLLGGMAGAISGLVMSGFVWKHYHREIEGDEDTR